MPTLSAMTGDEFAAARARILAAYAAGEYEAALDFTRAASLDFPDEDARTTYWSACLLARLHQADAALETLEAGVRRGLWWAPQTLETDPDFEALRAAERFRTVVDVSRRVQAEAAALPPREPILRSPPAGRPRALVVALHGRGQSAEDMVEPWAAASEVLLVVPHSTQPFDPRTGCWDDPQRAEADVRRATESVAAVQGAGHLPLVVAGFSQGAGLALYLAARRRLPDLVGCVAVAPTAAWSRDLIGTGALSIGRLRFALLMGSRDPRVDDGRQLAEQLRSGGADVQLEIVKGLGHDYPPSFGGWLPSAVDWVMA
jgi:predicted esterase